VTRVLPEAMHARIDLDSFERPPIFRLIAEQGRVEKTELKTSLGLGVSLIIVVAADASFAAVEALEATGETAWMFNDVHAGTTAEARVIFTS